MQVVEDWESYNAHEEGGRKDIDRSADRWDEEQNDNDRFDDKKDHQIVEKCMSPHQSFRSRYGFAYHDAGQCSSGKWSNEHGYSHYTDDHEDCQKDPAEEQNYQCSCHTLDPPPGYSENHSIYLWQVFG